MLRSYEKDTPQEKFYSEMYSNQLYDYVVQQNKKYSNLKNNKLSMNHALQTMDQFIDPSDPDLDEPNSFHAYQTAERIRTKYPKDKELQITGLIHDLGKMLFTFGEPNWSIVGDTFVLGCKIPKTIVFYDILKDVLINHPDYMNSELGIYQKGCGLENITISFGHDEYLYQVLKQNKNHKLSEKYMNIIRYHSFYPWHSKGEYRQFMNEGDYITLKNVNFFNQFDLYSKEEKDFQITDEMKQYYANLLSEYFPNELYW